MIKYIAISCVAMVVFAVGGCSDTRKQAMEDMQRDSALHSSKQANAQASQQLSPEESSIDANATPSQAIAIYDATLVLALAKPSPELFCGKFPLRDLVRSLYTAHLKPDDASTRTIREILVEPIDTAKGTYLAVIKTAHENDACVLDVFAFRQGNERPVIAHATYNPDFDDLTLQAAYSRKYKITDKEYAIAFEWKAVQYDERNTQRTTMLSLFRVRNDEMMPIFELCTYSKNSNNAVGVDEYETVTEDKASLETVNTWGKELYSILVTRDISRKSTIEASNHTAATKRTKILYQWDGERYIETNHLL